MSQVFESDGLQETIGPYEPQMRPVLIEGTKPKSLASSDEPQTKPLRQDQLLPLPSLPPAPGGDNKKQEEGSQEGLEDGASVCLIQHCFLCEKSMADFACSHSLLFSSRFVGVRTSKKVTAVLPVCDGVYYTITRDQRC